MQNEEDIFLAGYEEGRREGIWAAAKEINTPCGMDEDPMGMRCEKRGEFPVRHESRCRREDVEGIRALLDKSSERQIEYATEKGNEDRRKIEGLL